MVPYYEDGAVTLWQGDAASMLASLPAESVNTCVTSPPYWGLRDYGVAGQLGLEPTPQEYVDRMVAVFREVRRVLRDDGTLWLNLGDSYTSGGRTTQVSDSFRRGQCVDNKRQPQTRTNESDPASGKQKYLNGTAVRPPVVDGLGPKQLVGIPWRIAFALQADGWYLRSDIIWSKPNPMPESVTDRPTKAHEYLFLLAKSERYYYDAAAIAEPSIHAGDVVRNNNGKNGQMGEYGATRTGFMGEVTVTDTRNRRTVWAVPTQPFKEAHFATFPADLIWPCIMAGAAAGGVVLDPFMGSGTTALVAKNCGRKAVGIEINPDYLHMAARRLGQEMLL